MSLANAAWRLALYAHDTGRERYGCRLARAAGRAARRRGADTGVRLRDATWRLAVLLAGQGRRHYPMTLATAAGKQARIDGVRVEEGPRAPEWLARAWFQGWCSTAA